MWVCRLGGQHVRRYFDFIVASSPHARHLYVSLIFVSPRLQEHLAMGRRTCRPLTTIVLTKFAIWLRAPPPGIPDPGVTLTLTLPSSATEILRANDHMKIFQRARFAQEIFHMPLI
mgnify:CR=1 FL=1